jgi:hypothetical protein
MTRYDTSGRSYPSDGKSFVSISLTFCEGCWAVRTYKREVETILVALRASPWATHPEVQAVISEYEHLGGAWKVFIHKRRVALQILHASRALDSLLKHMVEHERAKTARGGRYPTLGECLKEIQASHIGGRYFKSPTAADIGLLTRDRNTYLHEADNFPNDTILQVFLSRTIRAINEAIIFQP